MVKTADKCEVCGRPIDPENKLCVTCEARIDAELARTKLETRPNGEDVFRFLDAMNRLAAANVRGVA